MALKPRCVTPIAPFARLSRKAETKCASLREVLGIAHKLRLEMF
jgi:hypothetical protein